MSLEIGTRVQTPEGPGTVTGTYESEDRFGHPPQLFVYVLVSPDDGSRVRQWRADRLQALPSKAESQQEALEVERHQEGEAR